MIHRVRREVWGGKRKWVTRDKQGKFVKGNLHLPFEWKQKIINGLLGRKVTKDTKQKISNSLRGKEFTKTRKRNISVATKASNYKWAKTCKYGISPLYKCKECFRESHRKSLKRFRERKEEY